jgi:hypothetical protein
VIKSICLSILLSFLGFHLLSQDEKPSTFQKVKDNSKVSGGVGYSSTFYDMSGGPSQRPPHFWQITANLNIKAGPINMPFSARFSPAGQEGTYPTIPTQIGMSPNYKDWTFHLGWRSLTFSDFSLSGNQFVGGGVEYKPEDGIVHVKALAGRFIKSNIEYDPNLIVIGSPAYERWGGGAQVIVGKAEKNIGVHVFKAEDDANSLQGNDSLHVAPADNLVYGVTGKWEFNEVVSVFGEYTISAITEDVRLGQELENNFTYLNNLGDAFYANPTTIQKKGINVGVNLSLKQSNLKLTYRRVDPGYRSLGAIYLNNDLEDVTANLGFGILKKKMTFSLTGGVQRNNLDADKITRTVRLIGSAGVNYMPNEKWNFAANYSNFTTNTDQTLIQEGLDTLRFAQVTNSGSFNAIRMFKGEKLNHSIMGLANYQEAVSNGDRNSQTYLTMGTYTLTFKKIKLNGNLSYSFNKSIAGGNETDLIGPTLGLNKPLFKEKVSVGVAGSYVNTFINGSAVGVIAALRTFASYKVSDRHSFNANFSLVQRDLNTLATVSKESIGIIGYQFNF